MTKQLQLPERDLEVLEDGRPTGRKVNVFLNYATILVEHGPQKNDTDAYLAHSIREKLDAVQDGTLELEDTEILFLQGALDKLREKGAIAGSNWYYIIDALRSATPIKKGERQDGSDMESPAA